MRNLKNDLRRSIGGKGFILATLLLFAMMYLGEYERFDYGNILDQLEQTLALGPMSWAFPTVGALCYATAYLRDLETGSVRYQLGRTSIFPYIISKTIACFVSACLATMLAATLFLCVVAKHTGISLSAESIGAYSDSINCFDALVVEGHIITYALLHIACEGFCAGMWAVVGLVLTGIWNNPYVAYIAPAVIIYAKDYVLAWLHLPYMTLLRSFQLGYVANMPGIIIPFIIVFATFAGISLVLGTGMGVLLRRKQNA